MRIFIISLLSLFVFASSSLKAQTKVGYTNVELLLAYYPETKAVDQKLQTLQKKLGEQLQISEQYFKSKLAEYYEKTESPQGFSSPAEQQQMEAELQKLDAEIQKKAQEAESSLIQKQAEFMTPIMEKFQIAINEVAEEGNFTYILNQTTGMNILYGLETMDVTQQLASKLGITLPK